MERQRILEQEASHKARMSSEQDLKGRLHQLAEENAALRRIVQEGLAAVTQLEAALEHEQRLRLFAEGQRDEFRLRLRGRRGIFD